MRFLARIGMLAFVLALVSNAGCKKDGEGESNSAVSAKDVAGLTKESLLVMKFHHDN